MQRMLQFVFAAACALTSMAGYAAQPITLCFERQEVLPWRTLNGGGLNFELLDQVATRLGIAFEYRSMPWKRCLAQLEANEVGGAFAVSFNRDRLAIGEYPGGAVADVSKRMHVDRYQLVRRKGARIGWDGDRFTNLDGPIGFQLGYSVGDFLRGLHAPVDEGSQSAVELAQKLIAGRLAGAALGGGDVVRLMNGPLAAQLEVLPIPLLEKPYFLVLSHAQLKADPQLAARIWKTIEEVRTGARYRQREHQALGGGHH